ncbi:MAG: hypothetical protein RL748_3019 [Pseudomonadota bacterium]|jgi:hypothetical protein
MNPLRVLSGLLLLAACCLAQAQALYRCGNTYQDKPCPAGQVGKIVKKDIGTADTPLAGIDSQCARRGQDVQKLVWAREAGATQAQMMEKAQSDEERDLIVQVYVQRASASEMKRLVEANCVKEKQLAAQNGFVRPAARNADNGSAARSAASAARADGGEEGNVQKNRADDAEKKKQVCDRLRENILNVINLQRKGGTAREMEEYSKRKRELDSQTAKAGC